MTKDVLVRLSGTTMGDAGEETIELIAPGTYYLKNGHHFILYDEQVEGFENPTHNRVRITEDEVEVTKKGAIETRMNFQCGEKTMSNYMTPYGLIMVGLTTAEIKTEEKEDSLHLVIRYALEMNGEHVSNCVLDMEVCSRQEGALCLNQEGE